MKHKANILLLLSLFCCLASAAVIILDWNKDMYAHFGLGITGLAVIFGAGYALIERKSKETKQ